MVMTPDELYERLVAAFSSRRFAAGLLVAFIDFLTELGTPALQLSSFDAFLDRFTKQERTRAGRQANTLIVDRGDGSHLSIRPFYNGAERYFRAEHKRFDYPSCAPHATQAWSDYGDWLDALVTFSEAELATLRDRVCQFVLDNLQSHEFDPSDVAADPPLFRMLLDDFDLTAPKGEPSGAAFQGVTFGFLRADNPHLQVEIDKVRTGSKRLQRVGDVDGWDGARLAMSAEVKQYVVSHDTLADLEEFANATGRRGTLGVIVALGFEEQAREELSAKGLVALDIEDMRRTVELWDTLKQRTAVASLVYYARHVEQNATLIDRIDAFLEQAEEDWERQQS
jgi:hypothetical protein